MELLPEKKGKGAPAIFPRGFRRLPAISPLSSLPRRRVSVYDDREELDYRITGILADSPRRIIS